MFQKFSLAMVGLVTFALAIPCSAQETNSESTKPALEKVESKPETETQPGAEKQAKENQLDWPMYRGNSQSTGVATSGLPNELSLLWEFKVPKGAFEGTAAIVDVEGTKVAYIGDLDGKLFSFNLETGEKRWEFMSESEIGYVASASYKNGLIYIGDIDGTFYCINDSGEKVWSLETMGEISSSANFYKDNVIFGSQDATLYCLNAKSGAEVWKLQCDDQIQCTPTIVEGRAFVAGCDGRLHVIDLDAGEEVGSVDIMSPTGGTPAALGDSVYFGTEQAGFFAVRWDKPDLKWHFTEESESAIRSNPAVDDGHVIFGAGDRVVRSLHPTTKELNWSTTLKGKIESSPVIVGERVYVGAGDGRLYGLNLQTGEVEWTKEFEGGFTGSPAVAFERLIIASDRGTVYCLGSKSE